MVHFSWWVGAVWMARSRKTVRQRTTAAAAGVIVASSNGHPLDDHQQADVRRDTSSPTSISSSSDRGRSLSIEQTHTHVPPHVVPFLLKQLIYSRLLLLLFQFIINRIMRDFPTDAFQGVPLKQPTPADGLVLEALGGLTCWDGRHFLHIAEFGYAWESHLAFFPLWPWLLRAAGRLVGMVMGVGEQLLSPSTAMIIGGVLVNNALLVVNGLLLFRLVLLLSGGNLKEAILAVYVMCWCPASIFFSALYSESLYMSLTLLGLLHLNSSGGGGSEARQMMSSFVFSFAFMTRSNGLLNIGYIAFQLLVELAQFEAESIGIGELMWRAFRKASILLLCFAIMCAPLRVFSWAVEDKFCHSTHRLPIDHRLSEFVMSGNGSDYVLPGDVSNLPFCSPQMSTWPSPMPSYYAHVQKTYWGVALFGYWHWRKVPFFLMAAPTLSLVFYGVGSMALKMYSDQRSPEVVIADRQLLIPFSVHSLFLALTGIFFYNVEVSMRILYSSSPFLYIVIARIVSRQTPNVAVPDDLMAPFPLPFFTNYACAHPHQFAMLSYLLGYFFVGTMMHVNWLPFV